MDCDIELDGESTFHSKSVAGLAQANAPSLVVRLDVCLVE
jgi:hypothetical protein